MRKQRMKYSLMGIIGIFGAIYLIIIGGTTHANNDWDKFFYEGGSLGNDMNTDYGLLIKSDAVKKKEGILYNIMEIFKLNGEEYQGEKKALFYAKKLLNYGL